MHPDDRLSQAQLFVPLIEAVSEMGGQAKPKEVYAALAEKLQIPDQTRDATIIVAGKAVRTWDRDVRWTRQRAVLAGLLSPDKKNLWELTEAGKNTLTNIRPGAVVTVFESENGVALWAESSAAVRSIEDKIVQLIVTSPPYPLLKKKDYANQFAAKEHADWLCNEIAPWGRTLTDNGSLVLNLGETWLPGSPTQSLYQERLLLRLCDELGYHLCQRLYWHNPSKIPGPAEWVNIRRVRVTPAVEQLYWLSRSPNPKANNRNVLRAYSESMKDLIARGGDTAADRPSGHVLADGAFSKDNGGSIAHSLISTAHTGSRGRYFEYCKSHGLPIHPARFPEELVSWIIRLMTDPGDTIVDQYGGSLTTFDTGIRLGRNVITCDKSLQFLQGGVNGRCADIPGRRSPLLDLPHGSQAALPELWSGA
jgi:site-specific DNA-methyltransferase (cytosine-N4-specific)